MKIRYALSLLTLPALALILLASCASDDSDYGTPGKNYIDLGGIEKSYNIESFSNEKLSITPTITSSFGDDDLEYLWTYYLASKGMESYYDASTNTTTYPKADTLSHDRNLDMSVGLPDGQYTLIYTVKSKSTGYSQQVVTTLSTASALADGYYVLKENGDGNTDLDLYNPTKKTLVSNILANYRGAAMPGAPRSMDLIYETPYVNSQGDKATVNTLFLATEADSMRFVSLQDASTIISPANVHYDLVEGEKPYKAIHGYFANFYATSNGVYNASASGSGIFGASNGDAASEFVTSGGSSSFYAVLYWSDAAKSIEAINYNGDKMTVASVVAGYSATGIDATCVACGHSEALAGSSYFLFRSNTTPAKYYLYTLSASSAKADIDDVREVPADSHFAKATVRAFNGKTATIAYAVDNNKLYSYDLVHESAEKELTLKGIGADEQITYVSNRYFTSSDSSFDYLVIGTQKGNAYKLYFYNMIGGEPVGDAVFTISGEGKMKSLVYVNHLITSYDNAALLPLSNY